MLLSLKAHWQLILAAVLCAYGLYLWFLPGKKWLRAQKVKLGLEPGEESAFDFVDGLVVAAYAILFRSIVQHVSFAKDYTHWLAVLLLGAACLLRLWELKRG